MRLISRASHDALSLPRPEGRGFPRKLGDHIKSEMITELMENQSFVAHKTLNFGAPPGVVFAGTEGYKILQANFIYRDKEPHGYISTHASRDDVREIVKAERRILGECAWECVYEEVIWAKVPEDYVKAHTGNGFTINFISENERNEKFRVSGDQAKDLLNNQWNNGKSF